jgi:hypothetical protein
VSAIEVPAVVSALIIGAAELFDGRGNSHGID